MLFSEGEDDEKEDDNMAPAIPVMKPVPRKRDWWTWNNASEQQEPLYQPSTHEQPSQG